MKMKSRLLTVLSALGICACLSQAAMAEFIYRGLLENNGVIDLRQNRFNFAGGGLSFNKQMAQILAAPQNFNCALVLDTTNPIPNVGNHSTITNFPGFTATYDANPPAIPAGHVSVVDVPPVANPAQLFANTIAQLAHQNPDAFNERFIVGAHQTDEDCHEKAKQLNQ
ncbi:hypothetical protein [Polycladidibacter stylochi]|uniref:hypothetical protein n=1 Tax=Polycladidibacter stylochi TaxID=1807766 RepID=UPI000B28DD19|nr:hypothetical protein [Pseudovibrio stylochi]